VVKQRRVGIYYRRPGLEPLRPPFADMIEAGAAGYVDPKVVQQMEEKVPLVARPDWTAGFQTACLDHIQRRDLGLSDN
jgi:hypothetical protein